MISANLTDRRPEENVLLVRGITGGFILLLCTSKCLASIPLKPFPKKSTKMESEKETPCQKYSQLSHLVSSVIKVSHLNTGFLPFSFTGWGFVRAVVWSWL